MQITVTFLMIWNENRFFFLSQCIYSVITVIALRHFHAHTCLQLSWSWSQLRTTENVWLQNWQMLRFLHHSAGNYVWSGFRADRHISSHICTISGFMINLSVRLNKHTENLLKMDHYNNFLYKLCVCVCV